MKTEAVPDSLESQFQAVTALSDPAVIEQVNTQLNLYFEAPASESMLTDPYEVQNAIRVLRVARLQAQTVSRTGL